MLFPSRRHRLLFILFSACLSATLLFNNSFAISAPLTTKKPMSLSVTENVRKTVLENGLTVLTKQVKTAPVVSVQVWYQIGSRDEAPGVNGIAHQLEHSAFCQLLALRDFPLSRAQQYQSKPSDHSL